MKVRAVVSLEARYCLDVLVTVTGFADSTFFCHRTRRGIPIYTPASKS